MRMIASVNLRSKSASLQKSKRNSASSRNKKIVSSSKSSSSRSAWKKNCNDRKKRKPKSKTD